jgi:hypothetical protein
VIKLKHCWTAQRGVLRGALFVLLLPAASLATAVAQTPVIINTPADDPLTTALKQALIAILAVAVPAVGTFLALALDRLRAKWAVQAVAQNTVNLNQDVHTSIAAGIAQLPPDLAKAEWSDPKKKEAILLGGARYMVDHFPDRAAEIRTQVPNSLPDVLAARLPAAIAVAAASPATPDVTKGQIP